MSASLVVQIVTWNSASVVGLCLESLEAQTSRDFEVVVVDNASQDDTRAIVGRFEGRLPSLQVIALPDNVGFSGGHNHALGASDADVVLLLNPDTTLPSGFVANAIACIQRAPRDVGTLAPRVVGPAGRLDSTGLLVDRLRRARDRDQGLPATDVKRETGDVFGCTGAVALHRRAMLDDVALDGEVLSEQLFAYYDDVDLSWRARLRGWTCRHEPSLEAWHGRAARNGLRQAPGRRRVPEQVLSVRNRLLVLIRCESAWRLLVDLPVLVVFEVAQAGFLLVRSPRALQAYVSVVRDLPGAFAARRHIRRGARVHDLPSMPWRVPRGEVSP